MHWSRCHHKKRDVVIYLRKGCIDLKMKKILSGVVAAMLAVTLSAPVLAATPGEEAEQLSVSIQTDIKKGDLEKAASDMQSMTQKLQDPAATVAASMNNAALSYFDALEEAGKPGETFSNAGSFADENGAWWKVRYEVGSSFASGPDFMTYTGNGDTITISASTHGTPSSTGYAITVILPQGNTISRYSVKMVGDNAQGNDSVLPVKGYLDDNDNMVRYVSFWVPYLATYQLSEFTLSDQEKSQVADQAASQVMDSVQADWNAEPVKQQIATQSMQAMVEALSDPAIPVTNNMAAAGQSYFTKLKDSGLTDTYSEEVFAESQIPLTVCSDFTGDASSVEVQLNSLTVENNVVTLDMDAVSGGSETGYFITIDLPEGNNVKQYKVSMLGQNAQPNETVVSVVNGTVSFWVPHFTVYQLTPVNEQTSNQGGNGGNPSNNEDSSNDTNQVVVSGTSSAAVAENPIKKTGTEMSVVLFAVAAVAAIAVGGIRVAVSKARKGE